MIPLLAGFECGRLSSGLDLLAATRHLPHDRMGIHYGLLLGLGLTRVRDGLPWRHDPAPRIAQARSACITAIFDLCHFDPMTEPQRAEHVARVAAAARGAPLWVCPMNEPSIVPHMTGGVWSQKWAVETAKRNIADLADLDGELHVVSVDAIDGQGEHQYEATDALVETGRVEVVGINVYPHLAVLPLSEVILATWRRYGLPVLVSETSWHDGHADQSGRQPWCRSKAAWMLHVMEEAEAARAVGAVVDGVCWYPITDMPSWNGDDGVWSNGLIRPDLSFDPSLSSIIKERIAA